MAVLYRTEVAWDSDLVQRICRLLQIWSSVTIQTFYPQICYIAREKVEEEILLQTGLQPQNSETSLQVMLFIQSVSSFDEQTVFTPLRVRTQMHKKTSNATIGREDSAALTVFSTRSTSSEDEQMKVGDPVTLALSLANL